MEDHHGKELPQLSTNKSHSGTTAVSTKKDTSPGRFISTNGIVVRQLNGAGLNIV